MVYKKIIDVRERVSKEKILGVLYIDGRLSYILSLFQRILGVIHYLDGI